MGDIVGILLAAGSGSRFGGGKLLHPLADGRPLVLAAVAGLQAACGRVVAVVRPGDGELATTLAVAGCEVVIAAEAARGMGHSLAAGVRAAAGAAGWLVGLADMPGIAPATYRLVAEALGAGHAIAAPVWEGRRGHPVGFAARWYDSLSALAGDTGARALLTAAPDAVYPVPVADPGIILDIDRPADLAALAAQHPATA